MLSGTLLERGSHSSLSTARAPPFRDLLGLLANSPAHRLQEGTPLSFHIQPPAVSFALSSLFPPSNAPATSYSTPDTLNSLAGTHHAAIIFLSPGIKTALTGLCAQVMSPPRAGLSPLAFSTLPTWDDEAKLRREKGQISLVTPSISAIFHGEPSVDQRVAQVAGLMESQEPPRIAVTTDQKPLHMISPRNPAQTFTFQNQIQL